MAVLRKFKRYEYPLDNGQGYHYTGSYTIYAEVKPAGFPGEKLVQEFEAYVKE